MEDGVDERVKLLEKFESEFEGLISKPNLSLIWEKSCKSQPNVSLLYEYAEEVAFEFFEEHQEEDTYQDSDWSDEEDAGEEESPLSLTKGDATHELGCVRRTDGTFRLLSSDNHITNGIPSEMVPENVMWSGREWVCWDSVRTRPFSQKQLTRAAGKKGKVGGYPCPTVDILETYEFDEILRIAGYSLEEDFKDLDTRMLVLYWLHGINIEIAFEWRDQAYTTDADELSIVWIVMGYKLLERRVRHPRYTEYRGWLPRQKQEIEEYSEDTFTDDSSL